MDLETLSARCPLPLGASEDLLLTQEMVDQHASTTGDAQWIHNDPQRARVESPFGGPIVQGFLLMASLTRLSSGLTFPDLGTVTMMVNYGFDRVRFVRPVMVGSAVRCTGTLVGVRRRTSTSAVLSVDVELSEIADGEARPPAMVATWLFLVQG